MNEPETASVQRLLLGLRLSTLACMVLTLVGALMENTAGEKTALLVVSLPYLLILASIREGTKKPGDSRTVVLILVVGSLGMAVWSYGFLSPGVTSHGFRFRYYDPQTFLSGLLILAHGGMLITAGYSGLVIEAAKWQKRICWVVPVLVLLLVCSLLVVKLVEPRPISPNGSMAVSSLRNINLSQLTYSSTKGNGSYAASLNGLSAFGLPLILASGEKTGYRFTLAPRRRDENGRLAGYEVHARPEEYGRTGQRSFYSDETGVIRYTTEDRRATAEDPPL